MALLRVAILTSILIGCTINEIVLPSSCLDRDATCQRNLNAKTLSDIGQEEAAVQLMCGTPELAVLLGDKCTK